MERSRAAPPSLLAGGSWGSHPGDEAIELPDAKPPYLGKFAPTGEVLGRGQFGEAVLLRNPTSGQHVVCKRMLLDAAKMKAEEISKVRSEVRVLTMLRHEHVVQYICCFERGSAVCIAMEYCDGGSLAEAIAAQAGMPRPSFATQTVARWMAQLCSALAHVHSHRVLHRDIKPENIFLAETPITCRQGSDSRDIKLGDFGISRVMSSQTEFASSVVGTPCYLSPELVHGQPYDEAADVWALGVVLFQLLTLRRPFDAPNLGALVFKIAGCKYDASALDAAPHPPPLRRLASREGMLRPEQAQRTTIAQLGSELASIVAPEAPSSEPARREADACGDELGDARRQRSEQLADALAAAAPLLTYAPEEYRLNYD